MTECALDGRGREGVNQEHVRCAGLSVTITSNVTKLNDTGGRILHLEARSGVKRKFAIDTGEAVSVTFRVGSRVMLESCWLTSLHSVTYSVERGSNLFQCR